MFQPLIQPSPKNCYTCKQPMRHIPAGVSRATNKPYQAFWSCKNNCKVKLPPESEIVRKAETVNASLIIMDEIKKMSEHIARMEKAQKQMFAWLQSKLSDSLGIEGEPTPEPMGMDL